MLLANGLNAAIIGLSSTPTLRAVYSVDKVLEILRKEHDFNEDEAIEWFEFNIESAYVGEDTPVWVYEMDADTLITEFGGQ
jgi:hypothetical protein